MGTFASRCLGGRVVASSSDVIAVPEAYRPAVCLFPRLPPPTVAAAGAALEIVLKEPERRPAPAAHRGLQAQGAGLCGFNGMDGETAIVPLMIQTSGPLPAVQGPARRVTLHKPGAEAPLGRAKPAGISARGTHRELWSALVVTLERCRASWQ